MPASMQLDIKQIVGDVPSSGRGCCQLWQRLWTSEEVPTHTTYHMYTAASICMGKLHMTIYRDKKVFFQTKQGLA